MMMKNILGAVIVTAMVVIILLFSMSAVATVGNETVNGTPYADTFDTAQSSSLTAMVILQAVPIILGVGCLIVVLMVLMKKSRRGGSGRHGGI